MMVANTMENTLLEPIRGLCAEVFGVDLSLVNPETQFGELPQWDSMGHMDLMVALEDRFGIEINAETITELISIPAILAHLQKKQNA